MSILMYSLYPFKSNPERSHLNKDLHLPPGPPGRVFVGNVFDLPKQHEWETYTRWAKEYGDLVYIKALRQTMAFVNSEAVALELLQKRSAIYSDRFDFPMLDLMGFVDWNFVLMRYGDRWRQHRRIFHQKFHPAAVAAYHPVQAKHARELLLQLLDTPEDYLRHIRQFSGAIIMEILYGIKVLPKDDPYIKVAEEAFAVGSAAANPGSFLVDTLPILKYVPEWMPGAGFKIKARIWRELITQMPVMPFMACKKAFDGGTSTSSFTASWLENLAHRANANVEEEEATIRHAGATAYGAGADTTSVALTWFLLAMVLYPEAQRKAQAELDEVIGSDQLPRFEDRKKLPYMNALCNEVQRWHPVFPLGIAHGLTQDDVYDGNFIPKGTIVVGNAWAMLHDEKMYGHNTDRFDPERFLRPGAKAPMAAFGFGRRICPGRYLADNTVFIAASFILKVFNISRAKDAFGAEIPINVSFTSGAISRPTPFPCSITIRSDSAESLLKNTGW
ncbi:cytochrome P450 [Ramaria rubella]|nr:cytochrome P450 [Ramaria rubella]